MNKRQRKKTLRKYGRTRVDVTFASDGMGVVRYLEKT